MRTSRPALALLGFLAALPAGAQTVVGTITRPGLLPYSLAVYEGGNKLFVGDAASGHLLVYDGSSLALLAELTITGGAKGSLMVVDEARGKLYLVTSPGVTPSAQAICVVDAKTNQVLRYIAGDYGWPVKDEALGRVYALDDFADLLHVIDTATDTKTTVVLSGAGLTTGLGVNPVTHEVFVSYLQGSSLDVVNGTTLARTTVPGVNGYNQVVNWLENKVYGARATFNGLWVHDRDTGTTTLLDTGNDATGLVFNPASHRVYTGVEVNRRTTIVEGATDAFVNLPMKGTEVAVRAATNHVYFASPTAVLVLDDPTQLVATVPIPNPSPSSAVVTTIAVNETTGRVFVVNDAHATNAITVLQDTEALSRPPVFVGSKGSYAIHVLDPATKMVVDSWYPAYPAHGLAVRPGGGRLWEATYQGFTGDGSLRVYAGSGDSTLLTYFGSGGLDPTVPAFSPDGTRVYVTNSASHDVSVLDAADGALVAKVPVGQVPWGLAVTPDGSKVYVANKGSGTVSVLSTATNAVTKTVPVGAAPWGVAVHPAGTKVYVVGSGSGSVSVLDTATDTVTATIPVGTTPHWVAFAADGARAYVGNRGSGTVSVVKTGTDSVVAQVGVPNPEGIAALPDGSEVWVVGSVVGGTSSVSVIETSDLSVTSLPLVGIENGSYESVPIAVADTTARIAGLITSGGAPLPGATVTARRLGVIRGTATSDESGAYAVVGLLPGVYDVEAAALGATPQQAPGVLAGAGRTVLRSFALVVPLPCTGFTLQPASASPSAAAGSTQVALSGSPEGCQGGGWTASGNGSWLTVAPSSGSGPAPVTVSWSENTAYAARSATATLAGHPFAVTQAAALAPPLTIDDVPGDARFQARVTWFTTQGGHDGQPHPGQPIPTASLGVSRGGLFWFFGPENPEMLLKVLNGCGVNGSYWVFTSAGTNVGLTTTVADLASGLVKTYVNPDVHPALPVQDTAAFPCGATRAGPGPVPGASGGGHDPGAAEVGAGVAGSSASLAPAGACAPGPVTLCIDAAPGDRRFRVTVDWATVQGGGQAGAGNALPTASLGVARGGLFWFFEAGNPEMLVKVLDGCSVNGKRWVFTAAGTNVGLTTTVTDTLTGATKTYVNPDVSPALPVQDTSAFACD